MPRVLIFISVLAIASCTSARKQNEQRGLLHLQIGTSHLAQGNYPAALRELLQAEKLNPNNPMIHNNLGLAYFVREKYDTAERHLRRALELDSSYTDARNNLGRLLIELHLYDQAIVELKKAAEDLVYQSPDKVLYNLGYAYFKKGQFNEAKERLLKALEMNRTNCLTLSLYGRSLLELRKYSLAAESLDQAIQRCRELKTDEPHYYSGLAYIKLGQREKAVARFEEQLQQYPDGDHMGKAKQALQMLK